MLYGFIYSDHGWYAKKDDKYDHIMEEITDVMGYLVLDIILSSLIKIHTENHIFGEVLESKLEVKNG